MMVILTKLVDNFFFFFSKTGRQQWEITSRSCLGVNGITDLEILGGYHNSIVTIKVC